MNTLTLYYVIGAIVVVHFIAGIAYLIYKINKAPSSSNDEQSKTHSSSNIE